MNQKKRKSTVKKVRRKKTSAFRQYRRSMTVICTVLGVLAAVLFVNSMNLYTRNQVYKQQEKEISAQIEEEKEREKDIEKYEEYVKTDDYIRDVAEEKLGLTDPNEILFVPEE